MTDYAIGGLDIATVSGFALKKDGVTTTQTFRADGKKRFLDNDKDKSIDAVRMGTAGRSFEDFLTAWLIENNVYRIAIEAPLNTNFQSRKTRKPVNPEAAWAGQAIQVEEVAGVNMATFFKLYGLEFLACSVCVRLNVEVEFVNQMTWRKEFLGTARPKGGSAGAKQEAKRMCEALGIKCSSLDAAEAVGVLTWLDRKINPYGVQKANDLFKSTA